MTTSPKQPLWDWSGLVAEPASVVLLPSERMADREDGGSKDRSCF